MQLSSNPGSHISKWVVLSDKMRGFNIKVMQVLDFKFTMIGKLKKISKILPKTKPLICPKMAHVIEINFNDLDNFNEKFMELGSTYEVPEGVNFNVNVVDKCMPDKVVETNTGFMNIRRSLIHLS